LLLREVPSVVPLLVVRLPDSYQFMNQDMGISVVLSEEIEPYRLHLIHFGEGELTEQEHNIIQSFARQSVFRATFATKNTRLQVINALTGKIGKLMHDFSAAGLYRYSGDGKTFSFA